MKRFSFLLFVSISFLSACSSSESENVISCVFEEANFILTTSVNSNNGKEVNFTLTYSGSETLDNFIVWNFGDGTTGLFPGTSITHTYTSSGDFRVIAKPTLRNDDDFCSITKEKEITVN